MNNPTQIGSYEIISAYLHRYGEPDNQFDMSNFIFSFTIEEDINSEFLLASMNIVDSTNIIDRFPIKGEEILTIHYRDFLDNELTHDFFVVSVTNLKPLTQQKAISYDLRLVSPELLISNTQRIKRSYRGKLSAIIEKIYKEYFIKNLDSKNFPNTSKKEFELQETTGEQTIVIPNLSPLGAIRFLRVRAKSESDTSSNYLFFQNREQYKMVTHENIIKTQIPKNEREFPLSKIFKVNPNLQAEPLTNTDTILQNVTDISFPKRVNVFNEIDSGAMVSEFVEIDILNKQYIPTKYSYWDNSNGFDKHAHMDTDFDQTFHTRLFAKKFFNDPLITELVFTDSERPNQFYSEIIPPMKSSDYYLNRNIVCNIEIYGRNTLFAGDIIRLDLGHIGHLHDQEQHPSLSGYWMIKKMVHNFNSSIYRCSITLTKDLPRKAT
tara:strand:- start:2108 stop:3415 length:1308 start_codon:yes stop_codon:yes gene_type:complete